MKIFASNANGRRRALKAASDDRRLAVAYPYLTRTAFLCKASVVQELAAESGLGIMVRADQREIVLMGSPDRLRCVRECA